MLFLLRFLLLFGAFYGFHLAFIGCTHRGGCYISWLAEHCNYIEKWRHFLLNTTAGLLGIVGYRVNHAENALFIYGKRGIILSYSCIGYGVSSFFTAFILAWPVSSTRKIVVLIPGLIVLQYVNVLRLFLLCISGNRNREFPDHHFLYNSLIYVLLSTALYKWAGRSID